MCTVLAVLKISSSELLVLHKDEDFQEYSSFTDAYLTL